MNNFDTVRAITRRQFWDDYKSPLTCIAVLQDSGSSSGDITEIGLEPVFRAAGPALSVTSAPGAASLSWSEVPRAYAYVIYRALASGGPFSILAAGVVDRLWVDEPAVPGTYYYRVTAIEPDFGETEVSNVVSVTV